MTKIQTLIAMINKLLSEKWTGSLTIFFHNGKLANKFNRAESGYINKD